MEQYKIRALGLILATSLLSSSPNHEVRFLSRFSPPCGIFSCCPLYLSGILGWLYRLRRDMRSLAQEQQPNYVCNYC